MEKESSSLLAQIKSEDILKLVLCLAYGEMKPVLKLVKYNKSLLNKLDINLKEDYNYKFEKKIEKKKDIYLGYFFTFKIVLFIVFLVYTIKFYEKGKFNKQNLKNGYKIKKKRFVDFMDNYILLAYLGFMLAAMIFATIFLCCKFFTLKRFTKLIIFVFILFVDLIHYIAYIIKFTFTKTISGSLSWFYTFDISLITGLSIYILYCCYLLGLSLDERRSTDDFPIEDDMIKFFINQFKGINIYAAELPNGFGNLDDKEKNEIIFKKENLWLYKYKSNTNKIDLILNKINAIRRENNLPLLNKSQEQYLPDFITKEKTKIYFYPNENIYKLSSNCYIFKYVKDEFQNHINNDEIMNIITNGLLDRINIIEKKEFEYISIYNSNPNVNVQRSNDDIHIIIPRIELDNNNIDITNTKDELIDISKRISVGERKNKENSELGSI